MLKRLFGLFKKDEKAASEPYSSDKEAPLAVVDNRSKKEKERLAKDFTKLQMALINWIPSQGKMDEREHLNTLIRHLAPKFDKVVAGKGRYKADILVNDSLPIEITMDLDTPGKYDLLCDQLEHYLDEFDRALLVIVGNVTQSLSEKLEKRYAERDVILIKKIR